jgi:hypothetical protein
MTYWGEGSVLERSERNRVDEIVEGYFSSEREEGGFKQVFDTPRGTKGKFSDPKTLDFDRTDGNDLFPPAVYVVEDIPEDDLGEVGVTEMQRSFLSHEEAVEVLGLSEVIERDIDYFLSHIEKGEVYDDFKIQNIHYFSSDQALVPMAIDLFDEEASLIEWKGFYQQISNPLAFYIQGNDDYEGLTDRYDITTPEAEKRVMEAIGIPEPERYVGGQELEQKPKPDIDIQYAIEQEI